MAKIWPSKLAGETVERRWTVPLRPGDSLSGVTATGSGVTVAADEYEYEDAVITLSAGTAGTVGTVTVTATTNSGQTLVETFYLAIDAETVGTTARDVCAFATSKIVGDGADAPASMTTKALEYLNEMNAVWRLAGIETSITGPLALADTITAPEGVVAALKFNLRVHVHEHYGAELTQLMYDMATTTKAAVSASVVKFGDVSMPRTLAQKQPWFNWTTG